MTNADKIRQMDDEELAIVLLLAEQGGAIKQRSKEDWLDWLKKEVADGSGYQSQ